jgi:aryl-alcohol dehydrogenase-like predicted oxidoreductase
MKMRTLGRTGNTDPEEWMVEGHWVAQTHGHVLPRCEQPPYSIFVRGPERDVFPTAVRQGMGVIVWSPLNGGWLTGKYRSAEVAPQGSRFERLNMRGWRLGMKRTPDKLAALPAREKIAADAETDLISLSLAFTQAHPGGHLGHHRAADPGAAGLPVVGADLRLDDDVLDAIDDVVPPSHTVDRTDCSFEPQALRHLGSRRR